MLFSDLISFLQGSLGEYLLFTSCSLTFDPGLNFVWVSCWVTERESRHYGALPTVYSSKLRSKVTMRSQLDPTNKLLFTCLSSCVGDLKTPTAWEWTTHTFFFFSFFFYTKYLQIFMKPGKQEQHIFIHNIKTTEATKTLDNSDVKLLKF